MWAMSFVVIDASSASLCNARCRHHLVPRRRLRSIKCLRFSSAIRASIQQIADDIKTALDRLGFEQVFLDFDKETGIGAGEDWEKRLYEELSRCHAVILVLTPNWLASKWCFAELTQARALGKVILPIVCAPLGERYRPARDPVRRPARLECGRPR